MEHTPPFYTSVDVRNAGFKLAPVDTNLFPGGWNNLTPEMLPLAVQAAMAAIEKICPEARNLLLIPENHTRNTFYLTNVARLVQIFHQAGLNVRLGSLDESIKAPSQIELPDGSALTVEPLVRNRGRLGLKDFDPCTILLNNDLSAGLPGCWRICTSSTCCRRCMPAGRCAARPTTSRPTRKWPRSSPSCWAWTPGSSTRCSRAAARSTSRTAPARSA
jgi:glutamate--cysteine ligase